MRNYLKEINFYDEFNIERASSWKWKNKSEYMLEISHIDAASYEIVNKVLNLIKNRVNNADNIYNAVSYAFGEVIDNVESHSESPIGGYICAQTYPRRNELEIAVVDCGIGIKNH